MLISAASLAQVRTFVSTEGLDNATCSRAQPCRTFNAGINAVQPGGEVVVLDSGGYGPAAVTKSVSLIAPVGLHASIASTSNVSIDIAAGPTDTIIIQNLTITALGGLPGIIAEIFGTVFITDCRIDGASIGIDIVATTANAEVYVNDTTISNSLSMGVRVLSQANAPVFGTFSDLRIMNTTVYGISVGSDSNVVCIRCESHAGDVGFRALGSGSSNFADLTCDRCVATRNNIGFESVGSLSGTGRIRLSRSVATLNGTGVAETGAGGILVLSGTNAFSGNTIEKSGVIAAVPADN